MIKFFNLRACMEYRESDFSTTCYGGGMNNQLAKTSVSLLGAASI